MSPPVLGEVPRGYCIVRNCGRRIAVPTAARQPIDQRQLLLRRLRIALLDGGQDAGYVHQLTRLIEARNSRDCNSWRIELRACALGRSRKSTGGAPAERVSFTGRAYLIRLRSVGGFPNEASGWRTGDLWIAAGTGAQPRGEQGRDQGGDCQRR